MVRTFLVSLLLLNYTSNLEKKAYKAIAKEYDTDFVLMEEVRIFPKDGVLYDVLTEKGPKGYAFIGTSRSKFDNFEYLALLDEDYSIVKVKVLVYRENYGGEVGSRKWLEQFIGLKEPINRVSAISGATISVNSLHYSINRLLRNLKE